MLKVSICRTSLVLISAQGDVKSLEGKSVTQSGLIPKKTWRIPCKIIEKVCITSHSAPLKIYSAQLTRVKCRKPDMEPGRPTKSRAVLQWEPRRAAESSWWWWSRVLPPVEMHCVGMQLYTTLSWGSEDAWSMWPLLRCQLSAMWFVTRQCSGLCFKVWTNQINFWFNCSYFPAGKHNQQPLFNLKKEYLQNVKLIIYLWSLEHHTRGIHRLMFAALCLQSGLFNVWCHINIQVKKGQNVLSWKWNGFYIFRLGDNTSCTFTEVCIIIHFRSS